MGSPAPKDPGNSTASKPLPVTSPLSTLVRASQGDPPEGLEAALSPPDPSTEESELLLVRKAGWLEACSPPRSLDPRWQSEHAASTALEAAAEHRLHGSRPTCSLLQLGPSASRKPPTCSVLVVKHQLDKHSGGSESPREASVTTDHFRAICSGEKQEIAPRTGHTSAVPTPPAEQRKVSGLPFSEIREEHRQSVGSSPVLGGLLVVCRVGSKIRGVCGGWFPKWCKTHSCEAAGWATTKDSSINVPWPLAFQSEGGRRRKTFWFYSMIY